MRKGLLALVLLASVVLAFMAGTWVAHWSASKAGDTGGRRILYYVDPMHPAHKSDKPGIAPDCGMQLEPVYEDGSMGGGGSSPPTPGAVTIPLEKQQAIGVALGKAERAPWTGTVRFLGRVTPDEARTYTVTAASDIWVRKVFPPTTGSLVRKDEPLAAHFTSGFLAAANAFQFALDTRKRHQQSADVSKAQAQNLDFQMRQAVGNLINMGVSESQIREMEETGQVSELVEIRSPADGFVLARAVSVGQFVPAGNELYRIANLDRVWILVETYDSEGRLLAPGMEVKCTHPQTKRTFRARVTGIPPQFDPQTRTMKVRLEADNPGHALRPDMFVDIDVLVRMPPAITVPEGSVIDLGTRKTVFVGRGNGFFEPRRVETGLRFGGQVEITKGLMEGERIVVSGNFMVDSESRLRLASAGLQEDYVLDPVCGMGVDPNKAGGERSTYKGQTFYFCNPDCKAKFEADPKKYLKEEAGGRRGKAESGGMGESVGKKAKDLVCGMDVETSAPGAIKADYQGNTYYFCMPSCKDSFLKEPQKYTKKEAGGSQRSELRLPRSVSFAVLSDVPLVPNLSHPAC